jgi:hypothetical protein
VTLRLLEDAACRPTKAGCCGAASVTPSSARARLERVEALPAWQPIGPVIYQDGRVLADAQELPLIDAAAIAARGAGLPADLRQRQLAGCSQRRDRIGATAQARRRSSSPAPQVSQHLGSCLFVIGIAIVGGKRSGEDAPVRYRAG